MNVEKMPGERQSKDSAMANYTALELVDFLFNAPHEKVAAFLASVNAERAEIYAALVADPRRVRVVSKWVVYRDDLGKNLGWASPGAAYCNSIAQLSPGGRVELHEGQWYVVSDSTWLPRPHDRCADFQEAKLQAAVDYIFGQQGGAASLLRAVPGEQPQGGQASLGS